MSAPVGHTCPDIDKLIRCKIGEFKTGKSNYCDFYLKSDEI
jgi:hypothetical protein